MKKMLIITGGGIKHLTPFKKTAEDLDVEVDIVSFAKLEYWSEKDSVRVFVDGKDVTDYDVVYIRLVGRRHEDVGLLVYYCKQKGVKVVDSIYERDGFVRLPLPKSLEAKLLIEAGISFPKTFFGRTKRYKREVVPVFGYPFVIKGTQGKQGHAVWAPRNEDELNEMVERFTPLEKKDGMRFIAQEFIKSSQRNRIFVVGGKAVAGMTRPMRWRRRFIDKINGEFPEGLRHKLDPIPKSDARLAVAASKAVGVDIGGVDILTDDATGKKYVIEVNSAPRWAAVHKDTGIDIEGEILKYLASLS